MPLAPGLFSMTTGCDQVLLNRSARSRATTSSAPPGANGTITLTGRSGKLCAKAGPPPAPSKAPATEAASARLRKQRKIMGLRDAPLLLVEIDDLDAVAVGVVEVGVAARKGDVALIGIFDHLDAARLHDRQGAVEFLRLDHECVMVRVVARQVRVDVIGHFRQHEIAAAAVHEGVTVADAHDLAAEYLRVKFRRRDVVTHADREVQNSGGPNRVGGGYLRHCQRRVAHGMLRCLPLHACFKANLPSTVPRCNPGRGKSHAMATPITKSASAVSQNPPQAATDPHIAAAFDIKRLDQAFLDDPYPTYRALREHDPVHRMPDGSYFLTRYDDLVEVYRDAATWSSDKKIDFKPNFGDSLLYEHHTTSLVFNDPPVHTRVRKLLAPTFSPRSLKALQPRIEALVDRLIDAAAARGTIDMIDDFAAAIPVQLIGDLLGIPDDERGPLRGWSLAILGGLEPVLSPAQLAAGTKAVAEFKAYLQDLVARRQRSGASDGREILSTLVGASELAANAAAGDRLSELELLHNCIFLLNAGHETTTNLIGNSIHLLIEHPDAWRDLAQHPELVGSAVEEFLRLESSNQLGNRRAACDTAVGGTPIGAHTHFHLCIGAPKRQPHPHLPRQFPRPHGSPSGAAKADQPLPPHRKDWRFRARRTRPLSRLSPLPREGERITSFCCAVGNHERKSLHHEIEIGLRERLTAQREMPPFALVGTKAVFRHRLGEHSAIGNGSRADRRIARP